MIADVGFFCSPIGLGHATRDIAISQLFERVSPKFVTGNAAAKLISGYGFAVNDVYTPPNFDVQNGALQGSFRWLWQYYQYYKECKKIASKFLKNEKPKAIISDEDFASAVVSQQNRIPTVLITDFLQTSFTKGVGSIIEKKMNQSMRKIISRCDAVIMPEIGDDQENIKRVGPIVRTTKHTREELRAKFSFTKKTITVSVGGTDAGKFLIQRALEAHSKLKMDCEVVVVSGPAIKPQLKENVRNFGFVNNLHEIIYASDLVISLAGKSTIDEANSYGTPGIFIPIKNHFEQEDNAKRQGYSFQDIYRLESLIPQKLDSKRTPVQADGARKACQVIMQYVG